MPEALCHIAFEHFQCTAPLHDAIYSLPKDVGQSLAAMTDVFHGVTVARGTTLNVHAVPGVEPGSLQYAEDASAAHAAVRPRIQQLHVRTFSYFRLVHRCPARQLSKLPAPPVQMHQDVVAVVLCDASDMTYDRQSNTVMLLAIP